MNNENKIILKIKTQNITNVEMAIDDHFLLLRGDFENEIEEGDQITLTIPLRHIIYIQDQYKKSKISNTIEN